LSVSSGVCRGSEEGESFKWTFIVREREKADNLGCGLWKMSLEE